MFSALFQSLSFLNPALLLGLLALPAVWWLLRAIPPAPTLISLPTARFLKNLKSEQSPSARSPWWLLLLRLIILSLIVLGLAGPVIGPRLALPDSPNIRLVIDNSWYSAPVWDQKMDLAEKLAQSATRTPKTIYIALTAPQTARDVPTISGPLTGSQAVSFIRSLKPVPWDSDIETLNTALAEQDIDAHSYLLTSGHSTRPFEKLVIRLREQGRLTVLAPQNNPAPLILKSPPQSASALKFIIEPAGETSPDNATVLAFGRNGEIRAREVVSHIGDKTEVEFDLPADQRASLQQIKIAGQDHAAAVYLLDERHRRRRVGIVGPPGTGESRPFVEAQFYLERALSPYAQVTTADLMSLLDDPPEVIIMPDVGSIPPAQIGPLEKWLAEGGVLIRFAGPNMTRDFGEDPLLPVPVLNTGRALDGIATWEDPPDIRPFAEDSPLAGIAISPDIKIRQQILADPSADLTAQSWATLADGTPLITHERREQGYLVFVHTTASARWSDLALSGTYVEILKRLIALAALRGSGPADFGSPLPPLFVLDGFGRRQSPVDGINPFDPSQSKSISPGPFTPPGMYGTAQFKQALNLGDHVGGLNPLPGGLSLENYQQNSETALGPYLLYAALILFLIDFLIMLILKGRTAGVFTFRSLRRTATGLFIIFSLFISAQPALAQTPEAQYANELRLAYVQSGNPSVDRTTQAGLEKLAQVLTIRTSAEPAGVAPLDIDHDPLVFFPMIYWPVSAGQPPLDSTALGKIQHYLDHGGTIVFDLLGQGRQAGLQSLLSGLDTPPLQPLPEDHVLGKSFYLLDRFPGLHSGEAIWVESLSAGGRDNVSSIIIGNHNWAGAWAEGQPGPGGMPGNSRQQELAYRVGVNLMMYALTGNYKADQVHVNEILERLGRPER